MLLVSAALRTIGVDETMAGQDSAVKLRMLFGWMDRGTFWFPGTDTLDPDGRLNTLTPGYFSGPTVDGSYWSDYVNPYMLLLRSLWPLLGVWSVILVNAAVVVLGVLLLGRSSGMVRGHDGVLRTVAWASAAIVVSTVAAYVYALWEHAFAAGLTAIGIALWWSAEYAVGHRRLAVLTGAGIFWGLAVASRYEVGWFLLALALAIIWTKRINRQHRRSFIFAAIIASAVFSVTIGALAMVSNGWLLNHLIGHHREPRWFVMWHNLFDALIPNRVAALMGDGVARALRTFAAIASTVAFIAAIALRRHRAMAARVVPLSLALLGAATTALFWPYGMFGAMPWVVLLPFLAVDDCPESPTDASTLRHLLVVAGALAWIIGLAAIPIHGGGQLGPRFFLAPSLVLAVVTLGALRSTWVQIWRPVPLIAACALLLFVASGFHVLSYTVGNNAYKARYVTAWSKAMMATSGPVISIRDRHGATQLLPHALRGRTVLRTQTAADDAYLLIQIQRVLPPSLVILSTEPTPTIVDRLSALGYDGAPARDLPLGVALRMFTRHPPLDA
jgi:hypothetical protein